MGSDQKGSKKDQIVRRPRNIDRYTISRLRGGRGRRQPTLPRVGLLRLFSDHVASASRTFLLYALRSPWRVSAQVCFVVGQVAEKRVQSVTCTLASRRVSSWSAHRACSVRPCVSCCDYSRALFLNKKYLQTLTSELMVPDSLSYNNAVGSMGAASSRPVAPSVWQYC